MIDPRVVRMSVAICGFISTISFVPACRCAHAGCAAGDLRSRSESPDGPSAVKCERAGEQELTRAEKLIS